MARIQQANAAPATSTRAERRIHVAAHHGYSIVNCPLCAGWRAAELLPARVANPQTVYTATDRPYSAGL